nr:cystatin-F isoform X1 [Vicugna pacos]
MCPAWVLLTVCSLVLGATGGPSQAVSRKLKLKTTLDFLSTADLSQRPPSTAQRMGMSLEGRTAAVESQRCCPGPRGASALGQHSQQQRHLLGRSRRGRACPAAPTLGPSWATQKEVPRTGRQHQPPLEEADPGPPGSQVHADPTQTQTRPHSLCPLPAPLRRSTTRRGDPQVGCTWRAGRGFCVPPSRQTSISEKGFVGGHGLLQDPRSDELMGSDTLARPSAGLGWGVAALPPP